MRCAASASLHQSEQQHCLAYLAVAETAQPNAYIELHNARVHMVQTSMCLVVPPEGSVKAAEPRKFTPKVWVGRNMGRAKMVLVPCVFRKL